MSATVVIATRDRRAELRRCLAALAAQTRRDFELVVVDDGSAPPLDAADVDAYAGARIVRGAGRGPAAARNAGVAASAGDVVLFTDDDTEPAPEWVDAALRFLEREPAHVAVEGPTVSAPFDRLYAHSIDHRAPGGFVTANIAYRRDALARLGGFCERFPRAHCEDMDLALRALELGPIGFAPEMRVVHWPRAMTLRDFLRHARIVGSELVLMERHPERFRRTLVPRRVVPVLGIARHWARVLRRDRRNLRSPLRLGRLVAVALAQIVVASVVVARAEVAE